MQDQRQQAEKDEQASVIQAATEHAAQVEADVREPLQNAATADGFEHLAALDHEAEARTKLATTGRLGRRGARKEHRAAAKQADASRARMTARWGGSPRNVDDVAAGLSGASERLTRRDPRVLDTEQTVNEARTMAEAMDKRHRAERRALHADIYGAERVRRDPMRYEFTHPDQEEAKAARTANEARQEADRLRSMPVRDAAARIEAQREAAEQARLAREARARSANAPARDHGRTGSGRNRPSLGL